MSTTIGEPTGVGKSWQRGVPIERLRALSARFAAHDGDRCLGAFSRAKENVVAGWLAEERLSEEGGALVAFRRLRSAQTLRDWRGLDAVGVPAGALSVERVAGSAAAIASAISSLAGSAPIAWRSWAGHPEEEEAARLLGLARLGSSIRASSEILAIRGRGLAVLCSPPSGPDLLGIAALSLRPSPEILSALASWPAAVERLWIDHYSSYNKRRSWAAVALRSFGGDPAFIEKPAEMSRAYREEHPERLSWPALDTPLMDLPGARDLLAPLGSRLERVRLMRLAGSGELSRHADITDRDAGTEQGRIARLHLPIVTDPSVRFTTWDLDNEPRTFHMEHGRWWYLDVRKPHRAENPSGIDRIHLVADVVVGAEARALLEEAAS